MKKPKAKDAPSSPEPTQLYDGWPIELEPAPGQPGVLREVPGTRARVTHRVGNVEHITDAAMIVEGVYCTSAAIKKLAAAALRPLFADK